MFHHSWWKFTNIYINFMIKYMIFFNLAHEHVLQK